jgi:glycine cleavage system H lipoate-binding protein
MPLPPWIADQPHKDNWLAVARLRDQTEAAQSLPDRQSPADRVSNTIESLVDKHHEF